MGLGGYLTWTAAAREIVKAVGPHVKCMPVEKHGHFLKPVDSPVFRNNSDFFIATQGIPENHYIFPLVLNNPDANYCKKDTPDRAFHRPEKHIISQVCEVYGIQNPELRCYLNVTLEDQLYIEKIIKRDLLDKDFITIEPNSKINYTKNRVYPFEKWQEIVDNLGKKIKVVQIGSKDSKVLDGVIDLTGKTNFLQAAELISNSKMFLSTEGGLVHAATAMETTSLVIITGYQSSKMVAYPQNINIDISSHGPCGLKNTCPLCTKDAVDHDPQLVIDKAEEFLCL